MTADAQIEEPPDTGGEAGWGHVAQEVRETLAVVLLLAVLAGVLFPLVVLGLGQAVFPKQADGSLLRDADGQVIGSELIGQRFSGSQYFHPRSSAAGADGYDASASSGLNLGPTNEQLTQTISERAQAYRAENGLADDVSLPSDAVTTSASGLDPDISLANAFLQVPRVARARGLSEAAVRQLVNDHAKGGILGERRINVLLLNLALDEAQK
jgi:K+-transporting ATPase ATPase C chain